MKTHTHTLKPLSEAFKRDSAYWGERSEWLIAYTTHRDADTLNRSNWACFLKLLGGESDTVQIERASHWAVGWVEYLVISPDAVELIAQAEETLAGLADYPVINDEHLSELEQEEANETWRTCYDTAERIAYIRAHKSQFEPHDLGDLLGCVRGKYFIGYASELIHA